MNFDYARVKSFRYEGRIDTLTNILMVELFFIDYILYHICLEKSTLFQKYSSSVDRVTLKASAGSFLAEAEFVYPLVNT